jgi:hypothetical protein
MNHEGVGHETQGLPLIASSMHYPAATGRVDDGVVTQG